MTNKHAGSNFDDFLEEEGILAQVEAAAAKNVIAFQVQQEMEKQTRKKEMQKQLENFCDNPKCFNHMPSMIPGRITNKIGGKARTFSRAKMNGKNICSHCLETYSFVRGVSNAGNRQSKDEGKA